MLENEICKNCVHFNVRTEPRTQVVETWGECRRYPPVLSMRPGFGNKAGKWVDVSEDQHCGEFQGGHVHVEFHDPLSYAAPQPAKELKKKGKK